MRTKLDALVTRQSLAFVHAYDEILEDMVSDDETRLAAKAETRNVCAHVSKQLADQIDEVCKFLDIRKRAFLEAAFIDAVDKAHEIMKEEGVYQVIDHANQEKESVA